jgi:hypothetical protein
MEASGGGNGGSRRIRRDEDPEGITLRGKQAMGQEAIGGKKTGGSGGIAASSGKEAPNLTEGKKQLFRLEEGGASDQLT